MDRRICVLLILLPLSVQAEDFRIVGLAPTLALNEFSRQADIQILFDFKVVDGTLLHDVEGNMSPPDALRWMLEGSGLKFDFINDYTIAVTPGPLQSPMVSAETMMGWLEQYDSVAMSYPYDLHVKPTVVVSRKMPDGQELPCDTCGTRRRMTAQQPPIRRVSSGSVLTAALYSH